MAQPPRPSNIDRALVQAPNDFLSIEEEDLAQQEDDFLNVEVVENDEGAEVSFGEEEVTFGGEPENFYDNLAPMVSDATLTGVASYVIDSVEEDRTSRDDWEDTYVKGLDLLGMRYESRTEPFDGATGVIHPLLNEAVTQFQSQAYKEMLPSSGPVRANIVGTPTPDAEQQAQRVQDYMNYQIMYEMEEYEPEFDQMLYYLGLAGSAFKKIYRDQSLDRPVSKFIPAEDVLVPYVATDLKTAERVTHVIKMSKNELRKAQVSGVYLDMEGKGSTTDGYGGGSDSITDAYDDIEGRSPSGTDEQFTLYECHCFLDLDDYPDVDAKGEETGIKLPYIVTVCLDTNEVLAIRRNFTPDDPKKDKIPHFVQYKFTPGLGFYGFGLIHLLGNLSRTATANLRQLIDAGTLSNMPAGFKARGLRIADEANPLAPGEFRDVDVPGGDLKASLMPLPYKEPSGTLFQLMGFVVEAAQRFIGTTDMGMGQGNQEMPVGTTIALLERGSRIVSAVHKRLHTSMKSELRMLARLFAEDPTPYPYNVGVDGMIKMQDFDNRVDILPVSDPNIFSMSQRVVLAQEQLKLAQAAPDLHNLYESYKRVYEALGVSNIEQILNPEPEPQPMDPSTENQEASKAAAGQGKMQAFPQQDHDAHIAVHSAYMNSKVAQMQPPLLMTLEKHIYEHLGMKAMVMAQQQMQGQQVDPAQVAQLQAQLIAEYQKSQPPAQEQDPLVRIKEQELQLRQQEMIADQQNDQQKLALDQQRAQQNFQLGRDRIESTEDIAQMRARIALQKQNQTRG
tara:strand:+ start:115 stop:2481 length:2367 start_codon:yes stop_codon:yes gene_type:complete